MGGNTQTVGSSLASPAIYTPPNPNQQGLINPAVFNRFFASGGEGAYDRNLYSSGSLALVNQTLFLSPMVALRSETCGNIASYSGSVAAVGTTIAAMGVYQFDQNGNATLLASTANDTTLWNATFAQYKRALTPAFNKIAGNLYGLAILIAGTTTAPQLTVPANNNNGGSGMWSASAMQGMPPGPLKATGLNSLIPFIANSSFNIGLSFIMEVLP